MPSVDGLSSGIQTGQMISALLAADRVPQQNLIRQKATLSKESSAFDTLKSLYKAALTKVETAAKPETWTAVTATSDNDTVTATADPSAQASTISFTVNQLAQSAAVYTADTVTESTVVATTGTYAGMTATEFVDAVNTNDTLNTTAALIHTGNGNYRIHLASTDTGATSTVGVTAGELDALTGGFTTQRTGQDAQITMTGDNPLTITSTSNTFTDLTPGLDITVTETTTSDVTVTTAADVEALADSIEEAINSIATALKQVDTYTSVSTDTKGTLASHSVIRRSESNLRNQLISEVPGSTLVSSSLAGVDIDQDGNVSFDRDKFIEAFNENPEQTQALFTSTTTDDTVFGRIEAELEAATNFTTGYLTTSEDAIDNQVRRIDDQIEAWDIRLESREATYVKMFTRLESALADMQQQSAWLASQIASLPTPGGNK